MRNEVTLLTQSGSLKKVRSVNQTSNGYVSKIPTVTEPSGDAGTATGASIIDVQTKRGNPGYNGILLLPYAIGSNNNTFSLRVIGWKLAGEATASTAIWIPIKLVEVQCTISSTPVGVAAYYVINTEMFADTIALTGTTANANVGVELVSPADDTIGHMIVDLKGSQKVEISFTTGGSATSCNALYALI